MRSSLAASFLLGVIAMFGALVLELFALAGFQIFTTPQPSLTLASLFVLALIEEGFNYLFLKKKVVPTTPDSLLRSRIIAFGCGFAITEGALILAGSPFLELSTQLSLAGPFFLHITASLFVTQLIIRSPHLSGVMVIGITGFFHFLYNLFVFRYEDNTTNAWPVLVLVLLCSILYASFPQRFTSKAR